MIGVLLITHGTLGARLVELVDSTLGGLSRPTYCLAVAANDDPDERADSARTALDALGCTQGVLVISDMYGATPHNIAMRLAGNDRRIVSGVNLAMLVRIYNYPELELDALAQSAIEAGRRGILDASPA